MARRARTSNRDLLLEAHKINYSLRSTFSYRKLKEYNTYEFCNIINQLIPFAGDYDWTRRTDWGISESAFEQIQQSDLELIQVFAHPRLLREQPKLVAYYRNIAVLS